MHPLKFSYLDLFQLCDTSIDWEEGHSTSSFQSQKGIVACQQQQEKVERFIASGMYSGSVSGWKEEDSSISRMHTLREMRY